jgi:hypothetical protein
MSVSPRAAGARRDSLASHATTALLDEVTDRFMRLPRHTLSAKPAHRQSRGVEAVLLSFDKKVQFALRQLCFERLELEARRAALMQRLGAVEQRLERDPDVLERLSVQIADNDASIRRLAKDAAPVLLDAIREPAVQAAMALPAPTEEEVGGEDAARVWRRRLESKRVTRVDAPYRRVTHDSPNVHGDRDLHNALNAADPEEGLSYYQKQQLRYGRARRGSTSIAGAWEGGMLVVVCVGRGGVPRPVCWLPAPARASYSLTHSLASPMRPLQAPGRRSSPPAATAPRVPVPSRAPRTSPTPRSTRRRSRRLRRPWHRGERRRGPRTRQLCGRRRKWRAMTSASLGATSPTWRHRRTLRWSNTRCCW